MTADDRSPGLAIPAYYPLSGLRSYFTVARVSRDIFRHFILRIAYALTGHIYIAVSFEPRRIRPDWGNSVGRNDDFGCGSDRR